jgi:cytochrome b subunit of formate dehydrogenase
MRLLRCLLAITSVTVSGIAAADPPAGSQRPIEQVTCAICHGESELWEGENRRLFVPLDQLSEDVHWKNGVNCHDCHGGDPTSLNVLEAHAAEVDEAETKVSPFRASLSRPDRSAERLNTQIQSCAKCHAQEAADYRASVHGHGLSASGLIVTAACADCHGGHGIYAAVDPRSSLHAAKVSETCAKCHLFIQERLQKSVHGRAVPAPAGSESVPASTSSRKPGCTDCHQGHDLPHPRSAEFRLALPERCGNCHADLTSSYSRSLHGKLTDLGYVPAAKCSDCHGSHDILPVAEPASRLSAGNRQKTCAQCHVGVNENFLEFDPHADPSDPQRDALLHWVNVGLTSLLFAVFGFFGLHSLLWLVRSLPHVAKRGRPTYPKPGARAYVRFQPIHRLAHGVLMTSFLGLALTGLPLKYGHYELAQRVSWALGGFSSTAVWHRFFGLTNFCCLIFYVCWFAGQLVVGPRKVGVSRLRYIFSPDSPVPNRRDLTDFARMIRWFVGRGPKPTFDRWTYWEKFDLWAAGADIVLIGTTGVILWFPNEFCSLLPGRTLNVADLIHGKLALLATGFVFAIHFFNSNLRPEKFPMDVSILTGMVSHQEMEEERADMVRRLQATGQLEQHVAESPPPGRFMLAVLGGVLGLSLGLMLLAWILIALFW